MKWYNFIAILYATISVILFTGQFIGGYLHPNYIIELNYYGEAHLELWFVVGGFAITLYAVILFFMERYTKNENYN